jgi:hypothetical protein
MVNLTSSILLTIMKPPDTLGRYFGNIPNFKKLGRYHPQGGAEFLKDREWLLPELSAGATPARVENFIKGHVYQMRSEAATVSRYVMAL